RPQEHFGRQIHEQDEQQDENNNDRQRFEAVENRGCALPGHLAASALVLQVDQIFGEFDYRHVLWKDLTDDAAAVENYQPIGNLMNVSEVVLDIDAGAAGSPDAPHEIDNLAHLRDAECGGRLI